MDDFSPLDGTSHYRLKSVDNDNSAVYSKIVTIFRNNQQIEVTHVGNIVQLTGARPNANAEFSVYSIMGNKVFNQTQTVSAGRNASVTLPKLELGIYLINVRTDNFNKTLKVLIN